MHDSGSALTRQILIAMAAGIVFGLLCNALQNVDFIARFIVNGAFSVIGSVFVNALKMLVVPLVFVSLTGGVTALGDIRALGRIGGKTLVLYTLTTAVAISIALLLASLIAPGEGADLHSDAAFTPPAAKSFAQVLIDIVPANPVAAMANGDMLPIIVFSLLFGLAITLTGERGKHVLVFFQDLNEVVMKMVTLVMRIAPLGVFCLIAKTFATQGIDIITSLAAYFATLIAALLIHVLFTYSALLRFAGKLSPWIFFRKMRSAMLFAFSTSSSNATIPVTLNTVEKRLGVSRSVASFTIPLGATINMDGTAMMQGVATVFIANAYGLELHGAAFLTVIMTATLASIGTAGIPSVGLVMLALVLEQVNLPVEGIALIIGVDRLLDMLRTAVNITGDAAMTCLVGKSENSLDRTVFDDPRAGEDSR